MIQISNLLHCKLRNFLLIVLCIEIQLVCLIFLDAFNFSFPIIRQVIGFIYLTFVPGIVLLRLLKLRTKLPEIEIFMYNIGLSIIFLIFVGFFTNIFTEFKFSSFSTLPSIYSIFLIVPFLCLICYFKEKKENYDSLFINFKHLFSPAVLFLSLIPIICILGAYLLNFYQLNILLIFFIILILLTIFFVVYEKFIPKDLYPFAIFVLAISILYHNSLSSTYIDGYDINSEYYLANLVKLSGIWNPNLYINSNSMLNVNSMLSVTMLAPIYSEICNMELTWVFKIIYPFFFSLIPIGIYHIYNKQINNEIISFLSVFYFMSIITYFTEMLSILRQQIGEFFFIIIIMLMISNLELIKKRLLIILFSIALVVSHYGLSCLVLLFSLPGYLFMRYALKQKSDIFHLSFVLIFFTFTFMWYSLITNGSVFETIVNLFSNMHRTLMADFLSSKAVNLATGQSRCLSDQVLKVLYLISQFFIVIGFLKVYLSKNKFHFSPEYFAFSFVLLLVLISSTVTSWTGMNIHRLYHVSSLLLSLFYVIGGASLLQLFQSLRDLCKTNIINSQSSTLVKRLFQSKNSAEYLKKNLRFLALYLMIFMLFNIGVSQEIIKDNPTSHSINRELILSSKDVLLKNKFYASYFTEQDVTGTRWLAHKRSTDLKIYADYSSTRLLFCSYGMMPSEETLTNNTNMDNQCYIYLKYPNIHYQTIYDPVSRSCWSLNDISEQISKKNLVYSSRDNLIYL